MNTPYIHHPTLKDDDSAKNGLVCFRDQHRPCSAACMAYDPNPPEGPDYQDKQWANCRLLVDSHRTAKHLVILAQGVSASLTHQKNEAADRLRSTPPPRTPV